MVFSTVFLILILSDWACYPLIAFSTWIPTGRVLYFWTVWGAIRMVSSVIFLYFVSDWGVLRSNYVQYWHLVLGTQRGRVGGVERESIRYPTFRRQVNRERRRTGKGGVWRRAKSAAKSSRFVDWPMASACWSARLVYTLWPSGCIRDPWRFVLWLFRI